jgi:hypothetical protein
MAASSGGTIFSIVNTGDASNQRLIVEKESSTDTLRIFLNDSSGTTLWDTNSTTTYTTTSTTVFNHFVASWDLSAATPVAKLYIKNTDETNDTTAPQSGTVNYRTPVGSTEIKIGEGFEGRMMELVFWPGVYVDLTDADVRKRFISQDGETDVANPGPTAGVGKPVGYGYRGELASRGTAAAVIFSSTFAVNHGTGGKFSITGDPSTGAGLNTDREHATGRAFGERWFASELSGWYYPRSKTFVEDREGLPNHGKRMGLDERDGPTRLERPSLSFSAMLDGDDEDTEDIR